MTACLQSRLNNFDVVERRPSCLLRGLDYDTIAGEYGRDDGTQKIVELLSPLEIPGLDTIEDSYRVAKNLVNIVSSCKH
jgi:hypothetical protein